MTSSIQWHGRCLCRTSSTSGNKGNNRRTTHQARGLHLNRLQHRNGRGPRAHERSRYVDLLDILDEVLIVLRISLPRKGQDPRQTNPRGPLRVGPGESSHFHERNAGEIKLLEKERESQGVNGAPAAGGHRAQEAASAGPTAVRSAAAGTKQPERPPPPSEPPPLTISSSKPPPWRASSDDIHPSYCNDNDGCSSEQSSSWSDKDSYKRLKRRTPQRRQLGG